MRVAFDGRSLATPALRGWDRYAVGLVDALVRAGVHVTLLHRLGAPPRDQHVAGLGCDIRALPDRGGLWWEQVAVPHALRQGEYDLYHAPAEHGIPVLGRRPTVLTVHSVTVHSYADLIRRGLLTGELGHYLGSETVPSRWTLANIYWHLQVHRATHLFTPSAFARDEVVRFLRIPPKRGLYPDFPKGINTMYPYILRGKLSVRPAQVGGIDVNTLLSKLSWLLRIPNVDRILPLGRGATVRQGPRTG